MITEKGNVFILSAKHGLVTTETEIEPYDKSLKIMSVPEKEEGGKKVVSQLKEFVDIENGKFVFLTDRIYSEFVCKHLKNVELPLVNIEQEKHLEWLNNEIMKRAGKDL
jgi:hypothetical protein